MTLDVLIWTIYLISLIMVASGLVWFLVTLRIIWLDAKTKRFRHQNTYSPDIWGNKPSYFDPNTGVIVEFEPGQIPERAPTYLVGNSAQELPTRSKKGASVIGRANGFINSFDVSDVTPVNEDLQLSDGLETVSISGKSVDLLPAMREAMREGRSKSETLKALGQGGRNYAQAAKAWDELATRLKEKGG